MEQWRDIEGFPGYQVSSEGRVSSCRNFHGGFDSRYHVLNPVRVNGYQHVTLYDMQHKPHQVSVHRTVAKTFMPIENSELLTIDHLDCDKSNNAVSNLEWVDTGTNSRRAFNNGLYEAAFAKTRRPVCVTDSWTGEETYHRGINEAARRFKYSPAIFSRVANGECEMVDKRYIVEFAGPEERLLYQNNY